MIQALHPTSEQRNGEDCPVPVVEPEVEDRRIGQVVDGKYHILRRLACGGMGSVYEARHAVVGRHFALKFLHEHYAQQSCMVQRFLREAQAAGSIASEHIIGVLDYGTTDGTPYLVMELVRGQDLRELLAETSRLAPARAVRIIVDACRGLELAHERGLVHRDLKPANICITRRSDGREIAKVIDFGVAKLRDGTDLSEEGTLIGTVGYMAPEQLTDQKQVDPRADIYALGVILYQALAGRPPHVCNRSELLYRIVSVDPRPLHELCPELPQGLSDVVHRALFRNKDRRYASVREFARALEKYTVDDSPAALGDAEPGNSSRRVPGLGTAETEVESAPTWVALARTSDPRADRQCEGESFAKTAQGGAEQFCRHPDGAMPPPTLPPRNNNLSQRALLLSVGALALSVVAMTTMFIFVYSHGSGALEAAAKANAPLTAQHPTAARSGRESPGTSQAEGDLAQVAERCPAPADPLVRTSILTLPEENSAGLTVERHALEPMAPAGASPLDCE